MKKLVVLLVIVFFSVHLMAQTFQEVKSENSAELQNLKKRLEDAKDRIYYLEVTLPEHSKKGGALYDNEKTRKELHFAPEELKSLKDKKARIEEQISALEESSYKIDASRIEKGSPNDLPKKMTAREYRRRNRSQAFSSLDLSGAVMNDKQELKGLLINDKTHKGENAYFQFVRVDVTEYVHRPNIMVPPNTEKVIFLPMGVYRCTVIYSTYRKDLEIHVDPRETVEAGKSNIKVHFWAQKALWEN
jgi:hypothetical protein